MNLKTFVDINPADVNGITHQGSVLWETIRTQLFKWLCTDSLPEEATYFIPYFLLARAFAAQACSRHNNNNRSKHNTTSSK